MDLVCHHQSEYLIYSQQSNHRDLQNPHLIMNKVIRS